MKALLVSLLVLYAEVCAAQTSARLGFKNDLLGISLADFQKLHQKPGTWTIESNGQRKWNPSLQCSMVGASILTWCYYNTTIAEIPASSNDIFLDGELMEISVSFTFEADAYTAVLGAIQSKYGLSTGTINSPKFGIQPASNWESQTGLLQLQTGICSTVQYDDAVRVSRDIAVALSGQYCTKDQSLSAGYSRVLYLDKKLAAELPGKLSAVRSEEQKKAGADL